MLALVTAAMNALRRPAPPGPLALRTRTYEGAAGGRRMTGAGAMPAPVLAGLAARSRLAARARYLVANNGLAAAGAQAWVSGIVGSGIKGQSAHPDRTVRDRINAAAEAWVDRVDADGVRDLYTLQAAIVHGLVVAGEAFLHLGADPDTGEARVRLLDPEMVEGFDRELAGGGRIVAGVEFDSFGRRTAYHVREAGFSSRVLRIDAADMIHVFRADFPGQVRGISWFAPVILRLHDYDSAVDAHLYAQRMAACLMGFIVTANGETIPAPFAGAVDDGLGNLDGGIEPGTLKVLSPGEDIRFSDPPELGAESIQFLKVTAHEIAAGLGVPYEALSGDLADVNYSSIRAGLVEFRRRCEALQHGVIAFQMLRPLWRRWITLDVLAGRLDAPGFYANPEPWLAAKFMPPRQDYVNPQQDVRAEAEAIAAGLMSRRQAVAARGYDLEALDAEIAADNARAAALGLAFASPAASPQEVQP